MTLHDVTHWLSQPSILTNGEVLVLFVIMACLYLAARDKNG